MRHALAPGNQTAKDAHHSRCLDHALLATFDVGCLPHRPMDSLEARVCSYQLNHAITLKVSDCSRVFVNAGNDDRATANFEVGCRQLDALRAVDDEDALDDDMAE